MWGDPYVTMTAAELHVGKTQRHPFSSASGALPMFTDVSAEHR